MHDTIRRGLPALNALVTFNTITICKISLILLCYIIKDPGNNNPYSTP